MEGTPTLASLPAVYNHLLGVMNHPRSGSQDIARVLREDTGLTARLLRLVNSALFSFPRPIESITHAVTVVGTSQIRDLALATSLITAFDEIPEEIVSMRSFWTHSLACGAGARVIASYRDECNVERFFLAGLLHDVGKLVLLDRVPGVVRRVRMRSEEEGRPGYEVEREILGFDHGTVGRALLEVWNVPPGFQEVAACHHRPERARFFSDESRATHIGDIVANGLNLGTSGEVRVPPLDRDAWRALGLSAFDLELLLDEVEEQVQATRHLIELADP